MNRIQDLWDHIHTYLFYIGSALIAIFADSVAVGIAYILHLPNMGEVQLQEIILGNASGMGEHEFFIRVVDGHLFIWGLEAKEILQLCVLIVTFLVASIKGYFDLKKEYRERRQEKMYQRFKSRLDRKE